jgi:aspartate/methionine/tyrosine aminotransferase
MMSLIDQPVRYDLAESTTPPLRLSDVGTLPDLPLGYGTSAGDHELRALIAGDAGVSPAQVLVTVGAIEAMALIARVTCAPGDGVVVLGPCFPPARSVPESLGARVGVVPLEFEDGFRPAPDRLAAALGPGTRLVSLASPQNPAGVRFTDDDLAMILALVAEHAPRAVVLVDETYRDATYDPAPVPRSAAALSPRVVTCSSLSKAHGVPGLRIGWLTSTDPDLYERLREAKFGTTIACSTVDEYLAAEVLRRRTEILAPRARRLRQALDELLEWADANPVEIVRPDGGALCCLRLPEGTDTAAFHRDLAGRDTRVAPGPWFGADERVFRLGFGHLEPADFTEALRRLGETLTGTAGRARR